MLLCDRHYQQHIKNTPMTRPILQILFIFTIVTFSISSPSWAVDINDEGAKRLKTILADKIKKEQELVTQSGGKLITEGDITIEQGAKYYAATLPSITYTTPAGENIKIGLIAINATPVKKSKDWKMSVAIPTPILITDENDKTIKKLEIGQQNMGGLWSYALQNFSKLSASYNHLIFTDLNKNEGFKIAKIIVKTDLEEKKKTWSGPTNLSITNFIAFAGKKKTPFAIQQIDMASEIQGYNPEILKDKSEMDSPESLLGIMKASDSMSVELSLNNIQINDNKNNIKALDILQIGYKSDKPKDGKVNQNLNFGYHGLEFNKTTDDEAVIPTTMTSAIGLNNFPIDDLIDFAEETIAETNNSNAKKVAATKAINVLPQKLSEAGTSLKIKNTKIANKLYDIMIDGEIKVAADTPLGALADLSIKTTGLGKLIDMLQNTEKGKSLAQQLSIFRLITEEKGDKNTADIKLDKSGKLTVNGKDMSSFLSNDNSSPKEE